MQPIKKAVMKKVKQDEARMEKILSDANEASAKKHGRMSDAQHKEYLKLKNAKR